jgi:hypothetical protein
VGAQARKRPVERDLDGVRLELEQIGDLADLQIGAVAQRDQLPVALAESGDGGVECEPVDRIRLEIARRLDLRRLARKRRARRKSTLNRPPRDAEQPGDRLSLGRVVAVAIPERVLEDVARDVLCVRPVAQPVRGVRVDAPEQRLRVG